jgi:hypothetical protein
MEIGFVTFSFIEYGNTFKETGGAEQCRKMLKNVVGPK